MSPRAAAAPRRRKLAATHARLATGGKDDWCTPQEVLERVRCIAPIGLDPCTTAENPTGARSCFAPDHHGPACRDGLVPGWGDYGLVFVNPPYSQAAAWARKVVAEAAQGVEVVSLVAARPDSRWFFELVWNSAQAVCFWKGRLTFVGASTGAPFPSAFVYHGARPWRFEEAFHDAGRVVRL